LLYVIFFILLGGLIGEYGIKTSVWRWMALLVPLAVAMVLVQVGRATAGLMMPLAAALLFGGLVMLLLLARARPRPRPDIASIFA